VLETIALYNAMRAQPTRDWVPRVKIFAGKAAPATSARSSIIKLACDVARVINRDPRCDRLKVVFVPNYNVSLARRSFRPPTSRSRSRPPAWKRPAPAT
jgi:starch phosphorylase